MAVELSVLAPLLLLLFFFVLAAGRFVGTGQVMERGARDAARAASQARTIGEARAVVGNIVEGIKTDEGGVEPSCRQTVDGYVDSGETDFEAGGSVTVVFSCKIDYQDLGLLGMQGDVEIRRSFVAPIDLYRGVR